jgi:two-component system, NtrC family, phosphoglycerate transport system response regulator PgtA
MSRELFTLQKSILVVDDDQNLRRSLALILKRAGYQVGTAGQACEALELLRTGNYNLIILDIVSPENRLTLLPAVLCIYPHLSVLVFTAHWSPETALEIEKLGVHAHLEKPVTPGQLLDCVEMVLAGHDNSDNGIRK